MKLFIWHWKKEFTICTFAAVPETNTGPCERAGSENPCCTQYVMDVFEVITFDYISKPITVEKLESVLLKAMQYLHMIKRDFVFQFRKNQFRISCDDIVYFEKKGRQAVIHTISENFKANMTTEEIWKQLDDKVFAHIHVSYIINRPDMPKIDDI